MKKIFLSIFAIISAIFSSNVSAQTAAETPAAPATEAVAGETKKAEAPTEATPADAAAATTTDAPKDVSKDVQADTTAATPAATADTVPAPATDNNIAATLDMQNTLVMTLKDGAVIIKLRPDLAPTHVARILELTKQGFYNGVAFHRVIDGFMAQTGDPTGTGRGGSGQKLNAEFNSEKHVRGTVSMARAADPNSADSQFFIVFDDASYLDNNYTVFGQVVSGMEFIDKIKKGTGPNGMVSDPDKIVTMMVASDVPAEALPDFLKGVAAPATADAAAETPTDGTAPAVPATTEPAKEGEAKPAEGSAAPAVPTASPAPATSPAVALGTPASMQKPADAKPAETK